MSDDECNHCAAQGQGGPFCQSCAHYYDSTESPRSSYTMSSATERFWVICIISILPSFCVMAGIIKTLEAFGMKVETIRGLNALWACLGIWLGSMAIAYLIVHFVLKKFDWL